ncbi:MAG: C40 family peptidase [Kocuria sp.]|nr:C40 family peptidase [Kocuria sp.]
MGKPYVWGGGDSQGAGAGRQGEDRGEIGFDCSGLTSYAVFEATGKKLPRTSSQQRNAGTVIPQSEAKTGDLVWWPGHIGIYAGGDAVIHASHSSNKVVESGLWGSPTFIRV